MAVNLLKHKRSAIPNKAPAIGDLDFGELAINTHDGCVYLKRNRNSSEEVVKICGTAANDNTIIVDSFVGDNVTTQYTLTSYPEDEQYVFVTINGVDQHVSSYSLSGNILTLSEAAATNDAIEIRTIQNKTSSVFLRDYQTYVYQPSSNVTVISGPDASGVDLAYDLSKIEVYLNGARLVNTYDYLAVNGTSVVLEEAIGLGDTLEIISLSKASFVSWDTLKPGGATLTTTAADQIIDTFNLGNYRTAKYIVSISHPTEGYHAEEILLIHDDTNVYMTTYAQVLSSSSLGNLSASISGSNVRLTITPANINTTIKLQRITVVA